MVFLCAVSVGQGVSSSFSRVEVLRFWFGRMPDPRFVSLLVIRTSKLRPFFSPFDVTLVHTECTYLLLR